MSTNDAFVGLVKDLLQPVGAIAVRRMFGGAGIYCDGVFFAILDGETLYFKTDEAGRAGFEAEGMGPFTYSTKHGPGVLASYYRVPDRLLDDAEEMATWARRAVASARGSAADKRERRKTAPKKTPPRSGGRKRR